MWLPWGDCNDVTRLSRGADHNDDEQVFREADYNDDERIFSACARASWQSGVVVLAVFAAVCIALVRVRCTGFIIAWIARSCLIFDSISRAAQIISLAQGKQYHLFLSIRRFTVRMATFKQ
jgi:hypothetical protein